MKGREMGELRVEKRIGEKRTEPGEKGGGGEE